ncbi:hypothetical protein VA596_15645 [Amycolatopsis sp., V23-08]|uniref:Fe-S cluster assembly protein HesB n=1 Tax=Amycolatopsis heterodermiae TaxID=3110235 RepID=A0ABU5R5R3_9PSEU|nr:hypothetical protein [Amycolatopsis sp., V23-08]MEA5360979.1 hypothetical protein [Amycolatopsis sp., V23-08]
MPNLTMEPDAAREIVDLVAAAGVAPEGGLRVQALASATADRPDVTVSVAATATDTDTVYVDDATGARVFADQATADVVAGRALALVDDGEFTVR